MRSKSFAFPALLRAAVVSSILIGAASAEAGLFDKMKAKRKAKTTVTKVEKKPTPRPRHRSHYQDAHGDAYLNQPLLDSAGDRPRRIIVDIERQRAFLVIDDLIAVDTAISTARGSKHTPRGTFSITEKVQSGKVSTLYHVYMPYWMRLGHTTVGMHVGDLPGYPASAGCIRLPQSIAPILFEHVAHGTRVEVVDTWDESGLRLPYSMRKPELFAGA